MARTLASMKIRSSWFSRRTSASARTSVTLLGHTKIAGTLPRPCCPHCSGRAHRRPKRQQAPLQRGRAHRRPQRQQAPLLRITRCLRPKRWSPLPTQAFGCGQKEVRPRATWSRTERAARTGSTLRCFCGTSSRTRLWLTENNAATSCCCCCGHHCPCCCCCGHHCPGG